MKLEVLKGKKVADIVNGRVRHMKAGDVYDQPDEKRAELMLALTPPVVKKAGVLATPSTGKGKGKGGKKDEGAEE
jgi:hypothetical protein